MTRTVDWLILWTCFAIAVFAFLEAVGVRWFG